MQAHQRRLLQLLRWHNCADYSNDHPGPILGCTWIILGRMQEEKFSSVQFRSHAWASLLGSLHMYSMEFFVGHCGAFFTKILGHMRSCLSGLYVHIKGGGFASG
jgi:hypothetical protein